MKKTVFPKVTWNH